MKLDLKGKAGVAYRIRRNRILVNVLLYVLEALATIGLFYCFYLFWWFTSK